VCCIQAKGDNKLPLGCQESISYTYVASHSHVDSSGEITIITEWSFVHVDSNCKETRGDVFIVGAGSKPPADPYAKAQQVNWSNPDIIGVLGSNIGAMEHLLIAKVNSQDFSNFTVNL